MSHRCIDQQCSPRIKYDKTTSSKTKKATAKLQQTHATLAALSLLSGSNLFQGRLHAQPWSRGTGCAPAWREPLSYHWSSWFGLGPLTMTRVRTHASTSLMICGGDLKLFSSPRSFLLSVSNAFTALTNEGSASSTSARHDASTCRTCAARTR
eukprot:8089320-Pyramimonas_sp.AAC.2